MEYLENKPYDEINIGDTATFVRHITENDIKMFAVVSGDLNPLHLDEAYAKTTQFGGPIAHGAMTAVILSAAVATKLPGPGSVYLGEEMKFKRPVRAGDTITGTLEVTEKKRRNIIRLKSSMKNQHDELVFTGISTVIAPAEKMRIATPNLVDVCNDIDLNEAAGQA
jgi:3-hydroxybutyryl-CoA dehydratase